MAKGPKFRTQFARRRDGKTNYKARLALLKSKKPRLVVRISNKHITAQIIEYLADGDKTLVSANTAELSKFGWTGNTGNLPSAYLVGYLCGMKAKKAKATEAIMDLGFRGAIGASTPFAVLKGILDAGIAIPHSEDIIPSEERLTGKHIADYAEKLKKEDKERYTSVFSKCIKLGLAPESMPKLVEAVKKSISSGLSK